MDFQIWKGETKLDKNQLPKICQYCMNYKKPKCNITGDFVSRKKPCSSESEFKYKKYIAPQPKKKKEVKKSDSELKKEILGQMNINLPETQKPRKTKHT